MEKHNIRKPDWLKIRLGNKDHFSSTKKILDSHCLHTICESGKCPNKGECWERGTATFMIGGDICTRSCKFCNTKTGKPLPLNIDEPANIAESIRLMKLKHAVITSVDRDDLPDLGASHWVETIQQVKAINQGITIEVLIPDFQGRKKLIDMIIEASPNIISHNIETVRRLTPTVRSAAKYETSLSVLQQIGKSKIPAKSGLMLGLGETKEETLETIEDLYSAGCKYLSIGQYLQPSKKNLPVSEYIEPVVFDYYKTMALKSGFLHVESGPLVRSSYYSSNFMKQ